MTQGDGRAAPDLDAAIIGAPKSGTSSLYDWLAAHPEVCGSDPDETYFFMDPDHPKAGCQGASYAQDGAAAMERFFPASQARKVRVEATPHHLYQVAARTALTDGEFSPLVIVVLREPASRLRSSFLFTQNNLAAVSPQLSFEFYVERLLAGETSSLEPYYSDPASLWVAERELGYGQYVEWLDWWRERLPDERLAVVLFDDLARQPGPVLTTLARRLGIDPGFYQGFDFSARNATSPIGYHHLHRLARRLRPWLPGGRVKRYLQERYFRWQRRQAAPVPKHEVAMAALREHYAPYNHLLASRYGLSVDRWPTGGASQTLVEST